MTTYIKDACFTIAYNSEVYSVIPYDIYVPDNYSNAPENLLLAWNNAAGTLSWFRVYCSFSEGAYGIGYLSIGL